MNVDAGQSAASGSSGQPRHRGREAALQMLYQWEVGRIPIAEVLEHFWIQAPDDSAVSEEVRAFANRLTDGVVGQVAAIDPIITESADHWRLERMHVMDRLILRLAVYEFLFEPDTPGKVIINEALELARTFSADDSVRFINGILDAIRRTRARE
jgi:transcription antitermination protein NusB